MSSRTETQTRPKGGRGRLMRLVRYAKPYLPLIITAILLLFVQANTTLALPDYMSNIVNVGIQQGGIENAVPVAIRQSEMNKLLIFLNSDSQKMVLTDYMLINRSSPDYSSYLKTYPVLATDPVYVLKSIDSTEINQLNPVLGRGLLIVSSIQQMLADPAKTAALAASLGIDLANLPPGTDIFTVLANLSPSQQAILNSVIASKFATLDESMIIQAAAAPIKAEYAALGMDTGKVSTDYIVNIGIQMLLITLLSAICSIAVGFLSARTATGMARDLRKDVFQRVESFSSTEFDKFSTASLITRSTNDITQIQTVVLMVIRMVFYAPIIGVGGVIRAIGKSTSMWWIIALAVIVLLGIILTVFVIALPKFTIVQSLIDRLNLVTRESLSGMMVIRAFNMQGFEENRFDKANTDLTKNSLFINRIMIIMMPFMMLLMNGVTLLIIWDGAHQVAASTMQVGDMLAFMQYAIQIVFAFLMMSVMFILLPRAAVSGNRIGEVLETEPVIHDPKDPKHFNEPFNGIIEYRHVTFRYPGAEEPVLHDISFTAQPGQTTALIGTTGSGKSTVVSLIPRFYDVSEGAVYVNGIDIREVTQHELRDRIGYVPQKGMLFSGTIESNLRYGDQNATEDELKIAAEIAQASEIVTEKPEGFQSEIAQGGVNVSGGQKQRLSIARALVKKAPIYIFDDSFSALDFKTDAALRAALKAYTGSSTVLIVTQRIATIMNSEQIIVLDEGRIVGLGTHRELMASCEVYRDIALSQLSKEELI